MPRRLISTDLDGTIVFNGSIPLRDREAMARWRAAGNLLVINTGRSVSALEHVVVPMGLEFDNAILYTGAAVVDENIRVRRSTALPPGVVEDILDFVEGAPGVTVFTTGLDEDLLIYDTIGSGSELLTLFRPATRRELDGREVIGVPMRFTDSEMASRTETYLRRRWEGQAVGFRNQDFIDVVPASASKGEGLRQLVASLSESPAQAPASDLADDSSASGEAEPPVEPIETWSIGDSWNDISMHQAADHSYALPWSPPEVVEQCDGTVSSLADLIDSLMGRPTAKTQHIDKIFTNDAEPCRL